MLRILAPPCIRNYLKKDISTLEKIQRRATKSVAPIKDLSYSDRLKNLGLPTLECRRLRYMIQAYKLIHGIDYINDMENLLQVEQNSTTRGHTINWSNHVAEQIEEIRASSIES